MYNLSTIYEANNLAEHFIAVNNLTGNILSSLILIALYFVILAGFSNYPLSARIFGGSFIITILASLMFFFEFTTITILFIPLVLFFIGLMLLIFIN